MAIQIQLPKIQRTIKLPPSWVKFFDFVQEHPYIQFEKLKFEGGEPTLGTVEIKMIESIKF